MSMAIITSMGTITLMATATRPIMAMVILTMAPRRMGMTITGTTTAMNTIMPMVTAITIPNPASALVPGAGRCQRPYPPTIWRPISIASTTERRGGLRG